MTRLPKYKLAFTLVELLIVISILGILAAVVVPEFQNHTEKAKESAAKDNLRILRNTIGIYAAQHNGTPPGYMDDNATSTPTGLQTKWHLEDGYLSQIPVNPFNELQTIIAVPNNAAFPATPDNSTGWLYKPQTKEIRLNSTGTDSQGISYFSY